MGVLEEGLVDMVDWEAIGAVGEILSAVGVIVTLAYLATQMRQNTRALRSGSLQTYREELTAIFDYSSDHLDTFAKARNGEELTDAERRVIISYAQRLFGAMETVFLNYKDGSVSTEVFEGRMRGFKKAMETDFLRDSWPVWKQYDFTDSFVVFVESEILKQDA